MPRSYEEKYESLDSIDDFGTLLGNRLNDLKSEIKVQLPCKVLDVSHQGNQVSVQILDYDFDNLGKVQPYAVIPNVPIRQPMDSGKAYIRLPIQKGDIGTIEFFDSSVDDVLTTNSFSFDNSEEWHSLDNGLFTNGFLPNGKLFEFDYNSKIIIGTKTNKFIFKVSENDELEVIAEKIIANISDNIEITNGGNIEINSTGNVEITTSTVQINGNLQVSGTITSDGETTANGVEVSTHTHPYTWTDDAGSDNTSPPN